jgi:predicted peroxiredoxin
VKLGILVTKARHLGHIVGLTEAAIDKGHEVTIFVMDEGTKLLGDRKFSDLAKLNRVSVSFCEHSAEVLGIDKTKLAEEIVSGSQFGNAMMNHNSDRVISL